METISLHIDFCIYIYIYRSTIFKLFAYFVYYELELLEIFNKFTKNEVDTEKTEDERELVMDIKDHTKNSIQN